MTFQTYKSLLLLLSIGFTVFFIVTIFPPFIENPDLFGAIAGGFVNPYSTGYSTDVILCWVALLLWVVYEAKIYNVKKGWICLVLGMVPGVVVGIALYLIIRDKQIVTSIK